MSPWFWTISSLETLLNIQWIWRLMSSLWLLYIYILFLCNTYKMDEYNIEYGGPLKPMWERYLYRWSQSLGWSPSPPSPAPLFPKIAPTTSFFPPTQYPNPPPIQQIFLGHIRDMMRHYETWLDMRHDETRSKKYKRASSACVNFFLALVKSVPNFTLLLSL